MSSFYNAFTEMEPFYNHTSSIHELEDFYKGNFFSLVSHCFDVLISVKSSLGIIKISCEIGL